MIPDIILSKNEAISFIIEYSVSCKVFHYAVVYRMCVPIVCYIWEFKKWVDNYWGCLSLFVKLAVSQSSGQRSEIG